MEQPVHPAPPEEWQQRLDTHLKIAMEALSSCAAQGEDFAPVAAFVKPDGEEDLALLLFPPEAKERAIAGVTQQVRQSGCRGLILVMDTWAAPPPAGRPARPGDAAAHPDRQECLALLLFTPNGAWGRTVPYQRQGAEIHFQEPGPWFPPNSPWNPWADVQ